MLPAKTSDSATLAAPKWLDQVLSKIRLKHCSIRTEQAFTDWIRHFILFHGKRHFAGMGVAEVEARSLPSWRSKAR